jgi:ABC-type transport system substrate-binding protein
MRRQLVTLEAGARKQLYDQVQRLEAENLPLICIVSPNILVGAKRDLGNFRPAVLEPYTLWNVQELYHRVPQRTAK